MSPAAAFGTTPGAAIPAPFAAALTPPSSRSISIQSTSWLISSSDVASWGWLPTMANCSCLIRRRAVAAS